ncbi:MAG: pirin family protein [Bacteroidales bacterium]|jgi:redox-sensitive bicupin YhaK (pirin superfamily)|nr:pirin family protein [Bacteroidales bacterium]
MTTIFHPSEERGHANHGWLDTHHSFSFASWYNPEKVHFGALRVLNDDTVAIGEGFGTHPHENMEIVSIPLQGILSHRDSTGSKGLVRAGEVQVMSAGTGITHSEFSDPSSTEDAKFFQIWIYPNKENVAPRYDQRKFNEADRQGKWQILVSPKPKDNALWLHQETVISRVDLKADASIAYNNHFKEHGVYIFVVEGSIEINGQKLNKRDGLGISETESFDIKVTSNSDVLAIEVPMYKVTA